MKNIELLESVLSDVMEQVTKGKGAERHGRGQDFLSQPWKQIADDYGEGFLLGQAAKKMREATHASGWEHERWEKEMLGAMAYLAFTVVHRRLVVQRVMDALDRTSGSTVAMNYDPGLPGTAGREHW